MVRWDKKSHMGAFNTMSYDDRVRTLQSTATTALRVYGLQDPHITLLSYVNSAVFQVEARSSSEASSTYAFRMHHPSDRCLAWVQSETIWLNALSAEAHLAVPEPIPTRNGAYVSLVTLPELDEPLPCVLFRWMHSRRIMTSELDTVKAYRLGAYMGRMHTYAARWTVPTGFQRPRLDWEGLFGEESIYDPGAGAALFSADHLAIFSTVAEATRMAMAELGQSHDTCGIIHADFINANYRFDANDQVHALDFDDCGWGYFLYDLAPTMIGFKDEAHYPTLRAAFLAGYRSERPLPFQHERYLDTFIAARHVVSARWLARHQDNPALQEITPELLAYRIGELQAYLAQETR